MESADRTVICRFRYCRKRKKTQFQISWLRTILSQKKGKRENVESFAGRECNFWSIERPTKADQWESAHRELRQARCQNGKKKTTSKMQRQSTASARSSLWREATVQDCQELLLSINIQLPALDLYEIRKQGHSRMLGLRVYVRTHRLSLRPQHVEA